MKIAILIDIEAAVPEDPQLEEGPDEVLTSVEFHVAETLRVLGHEVRIVPLTNQITQTADLLTQISPDLVFNLTEHYKGDRGMDKNIASLLDLLEFPYTGAGPTGLMLCRDKGLCKRVLSHHRIRVPGFIMLPVGKTRVPKRLQYPLIIKPGFEDGSDGISLASLVHNERDLAERVSRLHERMKQPAICEEFVEGREIYIGITGNKRLRAYSAREVRFSDSELGPSFATARVKLDESYRKKWGIQFTDAELSSELAKRAAHIGKRVYRLLHLRDYGRIDMRITRDYKIVFLEANPNPDLTMGDELAEAAQKDGVSYEQLVAHIVNLALRRHRTGG